MNLVTTRRPSLGILFYEVSKISEYLRIPSNTFEYTGVFANGFKKSSISPSCPVTDDTTEVISSCNSATSETSVVSTVTGQLGEIERFLKPVRKHTIVKYL